MWSRWLWYTHNNTSSVCVDTCASGSSVTFLIWSEPCVWFKENQHVTFRLCVTRKSPTRKMEFAHQKGSAHQFHSLIWPHQQSNSRYYIFQRNKPCITIPRAYFHFLICVEGSLWILRYVYASILKWCLLPIICTFNLNIFNYRMQSWKIFVQL